ncbi:MAG TPA: hypothetical protein VHA76_01290 [Solirubrobacterales bacterium]|nr:hypothetical protein [Solirubrobacterales bacterium]
MTLGLSLVIAIAGIAVIVAFGHQAGDGADEHSSGQGTEWHSHRSHTPSAGHGKNHRDFSYSSMRSNDDSEAAHVPEALWLAVAGLFGAMVGLLVPTPMIRRRPISRPRPKQKARPRACPFRFPNASGFAALVLLGVALLLIAGHLGKLKMDAAFVACATASFAIFIPSPARFDLV